MAGSSTLGILQNIFRFTLIGLRGDKRRKGISSQNEVCKAWVRFNGVTRYSTKEDDKTTRQRKRQDLQTISRRNKTITRQDNHKTRQPQDRTTLSQDKTILSQGKKGQCQTGSVKTKQDNERTRTKDNDGTRDELTKKKNGTLTLSYPQL
jgi:hypothetical protein